MNRHYELVLMLDPEAADEAREKVAGDVRQAIEDTGTLDRADAWGMRKMAYHSLKIIDGVLRFRIFKVDPEAPANPPPEFERLLPSGGDRGDRERRPRRSDRDE